ncbi:MAG: FkbM family methyltransferase [Anaerolineae bacterium]|nr:FkbM family methyltransferase [Anaerolineae bacterium]
MSGVRTLLHKVFWKISHYLQEKPRANWDWIRVQGGPLKGHWLYFDSNDGAQTLMGAGTYDAGLYDTLRVVYPDLESKVIWDVGAHCGYHSLALSTLVGKRGRVVAFEPNPHNAAWAKKNILKNEELRERIDLQELALGNEDGQARFMLGQASSVNSIGHLESLGPATGYAVSHQNLLQSTEVTLRRADSLLQEGFLRPDVIKVDIEGAEVEFLAGSKELLSQYHPLLMIEVHTVRAMFVIQGMLSDMGYSLQILDPQNQQYAEVHLVASYQT